MRHWTLLVIRGKKNMFSPVGGAKEANLDKWVVASNKLPGLTINGFDRFVTKRMAHY